METKRMLSKFIFINAVILCVVLIVAGSITASERTEYNMYRKAYTTVSVKMNNDTVTLKKDGAEQIKLDLAFLSQMKNNSEYLAFSPFGGVYYLIKSAKELFL